MKILTAEQMRRIDQECLKLGAPTSVLMENAGKAAAEATRACLGPPDERPILCLVGGGNNGGDGLVAARYLHDWGYKVSVYLCSPRLAADANYKLVKKRGITYVEAADDDGLKKFDDLLAPATAVIDALLGTGRLRPLEGIFKQVLERVAAARQQRELTVIAVDLPSGLDADSGTADPACLQADITVTLAFPKLGQFRLPGAEKVGRLIIADIGIPAQLADDITTELITAEMARSLLPARPIDANKGTFGRVLVAAGSLNYIGAAYLACSGALRAGAGLVTLATAPTLLPVLAAKLTEVTYLPLPEASPGVIAAEAAAEIAQQTDDYDALLLGCGLGQDPATAEFVGTLLKEKGLPPAVLDADALNILSAVPDWWQQLGGNAVLTPHPGEMARLAGMTAAEVQADRLGVAARLAAAWRQTVVLKGAYTVIAAADGRRRLSPFANPALATAGTGDVLAGIIAGLLAQGLAPFEAATLGVYLHAKAGETVSDAIGDTGMIASDLLPALPPTIKRLKEPAGEE